MVNETPRELESPPKGEGATTNGEDASPGTNQGKEKEDPVEEEELVEDHKEGSREPDPPSQRARPQQPPVRTSRPRYNYNRQEGYPSGHGDPWLYQKREPRPPSFVLPVVVFSVFLVSWLGILLVFNADTGSGDEAPAALAVEDVFFQLDELDEEMVQIEISIYITNYGREESGEIELVFNALNMSNSFGVDNATTEIGRLAGERTVEARVPMELPTNTSYRIKIRVAEDGMTTIEGSGEISLGEVSQSVVDFTTEDGSSGRGAPNMYDDDEESAMDAPGFASGFTLSALVATAAWVYLRKQREVGP